MLKNLIQKIRYRTLRLLIGQTPIVANVNVYGGAFVTEPPGATVHFHNSIPDGCSFMGEGSGITRQNASQLIRKWDGGL